MDKGDYLVFQTIFSGGQETPMLFTYREKKIFTFKNNMLLDIFLWNTKGISTANGRTTKRFQQLWKTLFPVRDILNEP